MNMQEAAKQLQQSIGLPPSVAAVLIWRSDKFSGLKVWIDADYNGSLSGIPTAYAGYDVEVERRPSIVSH
jgi:hypothetical protein